MHLQLGIRHRWDTACGENPPLSVTSMRLGGVSRGRYASLNLGLHVSDTPDAVQENRRRFLESLELKGTPLFIPQQTHSANVAQVSAEHLSQPPEFADTDALITNIPGTALGVLVADCAPVFLYDPIHGAIGMVHAGWRGAYAHIVRRTFQAMGGAFGTLPRECSAMVGPSIGACCYEVSSELAGQFREEFGKEVVEGRRLNLQRVVQVELEQAGVRQERIAHSGYCTACRTDILFSHRREGAPTGRQLALIAL